MRGLVARKHYSLTPRKSSMLKDISTAYAFYKVLLGYKPNTSYLGTLT